MTDEEFNLSEKRIQASHNDSSQAKYREEDVKEFIRQLKKENLLYYEGEVTDDINKRIDKLAGEKLKEEK